MIALSEKRNYGPVIHHFKQANPSGYFQGLVERFQGLDDRTRNALIGGVGLGGLGMLGGAIFSKPGNRLRNAALLGLGGAGLGGLVGYKTPDMVASVVERQQAERDKLYAAQDAAKAAEKQPALSSKQNLERAVNPKRLIPLPTSGPLGAFRGTVSTGGDNRLGAIGSEAQRMAMAPVRGLESAGDALGSWGSNTALRTRFLAEDAWDGAKNLGRSISEAPGKALDGATDWVDGFVTGQ